MCSQNQWWSWTLNESWCHCCLVCGVPAPGEGHGVFTSEAVDQFHVFSEAVGACLPVVALRPQACTLEPPEAEFRDYLAQEGWYRALPLAKLTPETFLQSLEEISPRTTSQLDELSAALRQRLPELFADA